LNISIIIFCYNEKGSIADVISSCIDSVKKFADSFEVIIVDDGSTDGSSEIIQSQVALYSFIQYIRHSTNLGIGMALRSGYKASSKEFVCAIPGDGQFDVNELGLIQPFPIHRFYSFYRPETSYNLYRRVLNISNRLFNRVCLGIKLRDVNWIKVYRKDQLDFANIELKSSIVESEICAKLIKAGSRPIELPSVYHLRLSGESKGGNWKTLSKALSEMNTLVQVLFRFKKRL
jgi:glycosyltransferase involved in cell wall biosynthesis